MTRSGPKNFVRRTARLGMVVGVVFGVLGWPLAPSSGAVVAPAVDLAAAPADGPPGPEVPYRRDHACAAGAVMPNSDVTKPPPAYTALNGDRAHRFSTGAGVIVAVIDTGVRAQPRLADMIAGGDYVADSDGFTDCDGHGTIVAGIIAAAPAPDDGLVGMAPDARILAIRQSSQAYRSQQVGDPNDPNTSATAGNLRSLARAIVHATNMGASVINISVVNCVKASEPIDQQALGGALAYAVDVHDVLVIAAAGNNTAVDTGSGATPCSSNADRDPAKPGDSRNWAAVSTISSPSWFDDYVLSVGFVSPEGVLAKESALGPWVDVAAPGSGVVSLSSAQPDAVINGLPGRDHTVVPIAGTSFAAAYTSGVAALLRSRFPDMSARQVAARLIATAHHPPGGVDNGVGAGMIDPIAALTFDPHIADPPAITVGSAALSLPVPPPPPDHGPATVAATVLGAVVAAGAAIVLAVLAFRPTRNRSSR